MVQNKVLRLQFTPFGASSIMRFTLSVIAISSLLVIISRYFLSRYNYDFSLRDRASDVRFGVVVDCGSTGTRAHVFQWFKDQKQAAVPRVIPLRDESTGKAITMHVTPGLSTLQDQPHKASDYMEPIMQFICDSVPSERHVDTPVYFMATAGLRLLDDDVQKEILDDITDDLKIKYNFPQIKSQVITGEFEGIYSWLSLNLDRIYHDPEQSEIHDRSLGMIEMGGASIQIAFELTSEIENHITSSLESDDAITAYLNEQVNVNVSGDRYVKLFVTTFLGLGVVSAREFAIDLLVRDHLKDIGKLGNQDSDFVARNSEIVLRDPCLNRGSSELVNRPMEVRTSLERTIGFTLKPESSVFTVKLEGTGNYSDCINLLERVLQESKLSQLNCLPGRSSCPMTLLGESFIPYQHYTFAGLSEMFFTTSEMVCSSEQFDRNQVEDETIRICHSDYQDLIVKYSHSGLVKQHDRVQHQCFRSSWLLTVLNSYGFKMPSSYKLFNPMDRLNGREVDWTVGAFMSEMTLSNRNSP